MKQAITLKQINDSSFIKGPLFNEAVGFINEAIISKRWHDQIVKIENHEAIILTPFGKYESIMNEVVKEFKSKEWDCYWDSAYDARGPHHCFYVHKKHLETL